MNAKSLDELHAVKEKHDDTQRDDAQRGYSELTEKKQVQIRMRLTDAVFARMVVDVRSMLDTMPPEHKAGVDGDFLMAIAEQPNKILKCAMYRFKVISRVQSSSPRHVEAEAATHRFLGAQRR